MPSTHALLRPLAIGLMLSSHALHADIETQTVAYQSIPVQFELDATLEAVNQSTVSAQTSGVIQAIHFDINDTVEAGALLVEIVDTQQRAALAQAQANVAKANAMNEDAQILLKRNERLLKQNTLSQGEYDSSVAQAKSATASVKAAQAALSQAQEQLSYTRVTAPYSGIVKARHIELGELVNPGQPLMTGMALQPLRAVANVPQRIVSHVHKAEQIHIEFNAERIPASGVTVFPYADAQHHSVRLRADLPQTHTETLYPGMWTRLVIRSGEREAIVIPHSAVIRRAEMSAVYVIENNQPRLRQIRLGNAQDNGIEVLSGLSINDVYAIDAYEQLAHLAKGE
ncbi:MAG: efflux RND transporter periplasmic adaptor subunit [Bacterioplanes sp.]|nr:efflux RND transporter periplasmic adaptor subunit [Bacterioplanes sp.]